MKTPGAVKKAAGTAVRFSRMGPLCAAFLLLSPLPSWADNPSLERDFQSMMTWLSGQVAPGIIFHSAVSFDPPVELAPREKELDLTLGLGAIPLDLNSFPAMEVQSDDVEQKDAFDPVVLFPDITGHLRYGLKNRWELALRLSDMTVPKYQVSANSQGEGQSNIFGLQVRKHLGGGRRPRLSLAAEGNYMKGGFKFFNQFKDVEVSDGVFLDSENTGAIQWKAASVGGSAMLSRTYGPWIPFAGLGLYYGRGKVTSNIKAEFKTELVNPIEGNGTSRVSQGQMRLIMGAQYNRKTMGLYGSMEVLTVGHLPGKAVTFHLGASFPLGSAAKKSFREARQRAVQPKTALRPAGKAETAAAETAPAGLIVIR